MRPFLQSLPLLRGYFERKKFWQGYDAFAQTKDAGEYIRQRAKQGQPFALMVSYGPPHFPYDTPRKPTRTLSTRKDPVAAQCARSERAKAQRDGQGYYSHCTAIDKCVADVLGVLRETGLEKKTIVLFTADHGEMLGSHGCPPTMKQQPWDEAAHVPLLLRYPAAHGRQGRAVQTALTTPDILPTLLGLAGVAIPATIEGEDLSPLIRGGREQPDRAALYMGVAPFAGSGFNKEYRAIRTSRYTYVRGLDGPWLLFDDEKDPYQLKNLAAAPENGALCRQFDDCLHAALQKIGDPFRPGRVLYRAVGTDGCSWPQHLLRTRRTLANSTSTIIARLAHAAWRASACNWNGVNVRQEGLIRPPIIYFQRPSGCLMVVRTGGDLSVYPAGALFAVISWAGRAVAAVAKQVVKVPVFGRLGIA